jgi:pimeloyl-ACP methyl ester carboxylesterase
MKRHPSMVQTLAPTALLFTLLACTGSSEPAVGDAGSGDAAPAASCSAASAPITLETSTGALVGTIEVPARCPPYPVALFHSGSGPTDRDGNSAAFRNDSLKLLAEALAARGIASVRYDKRGIAASQPAGPASERDLRFSTYVEDARRWLDFLAVERRFSRRFVIGHSEGSLIGMLAAEGPSDVHLVSVAGAGRPAGTILREQLARQLPPALLMQANAIIAELEAGREVASVPQPLDRLFPPSIQPYLIDWFQHDPAAIIKRLVNGPLVVQGTTDLQVAIQDAELLRAARPDAELLLVEGMNHVLKQVGGDLQAQRPSYGDPTLPLHPGLVEPIATFITRPR